jgi:hypothetical protein
MPSRKIKLNRQLRDDPPFQRMSRMQLIRHAIECEKLLRDLMQEHTALLMAISDAQTRNRILYRDVTQP